MGLVSLLLLRLLVPGAPSGFTEAPVFVPLFTPRGVPPGTYQTYVSGEPLEAVLAQVRQDASAPSGTSSFEPRSVIASEAFGQSGGYNRWKLALLYGARRTRVARGPRVVDGQVVEAWTLISPYPDAELQRLNPGTLLIVLRLPA